MNLKSQLESLSEFLPQEPWPLGGSSHGSQGGQISPVIGSPLGFSMYDWFITYNYYHWTYAINCNDVHQMKFGRQVSDLWTDAATVVKTVREEKGSKEKKSVEEDQTARKGRKVAKYCVFFWCFVVPKVRKVGSLKRRVRSYLVRWEIKNCMPLWR